MLVLGIDPGSIKIGYALLQYTSFSPNIMPNVDTFSSINNNEAFCTSNLNFNETKLNSKLPIKLVKSGVLDLKTSMPFNERLLKVSQLSKELIASLHPDEIAIESLIYVKSPTSLIKLAQARGAMLASFLETHLNKIFEYPPNTVKLVATGYGHAKKIGIQKVLNWELGPKEYYSHDESDAIAVAICHVLKHITSDKVATKILENSNIGKVNYQHTEANKSKNGKKMQSKLRTEISKKSTLSDCLRHKL